MSSGYFIVRAKIKPIIPPYFFKGDGFDEAEYGYNRLCEFIWDNRYNPQLTISEILEEMRGFPFYLDVGKRVMSYGDDYYFDMTELIEKMGGDVTRCYADTVFRKDEMEILLPYKCYFYKE